MLTRARSALGAGLALALALGAASAVTAAEITFSTAATETLGGVNFTNQDIMFYDTIAMGAPTQVFDGTQLAVNTNVDALHLLPNGDVVFSTMADSSIGALNFLDGDLVQVDPTDPTTATVIFSESFITGDPTFVDIDALWIAGNGDYVISTRLAASIGALSFQDGDLVRFTPGDSTSASIVFDDALFTSAALNNTSGAHFMANGDIVMTVEGPATLGGISFESGDVIQYDPGANVAKVIFDDTDAAWAVPPGQVDAVFVPEPSSLLLLAMGAAGLLRMRRGQNG
jgi:hypothetical protein